MDSASDLTSSPKAPRSPSSASSANYIGIVQPKGFPALPAGWVSETETYPSPDGKAQLFAVTHHEKDWKNPRALIVLHGMGEHGGRYLHFPHYLGDFFGAIHCIDHRGHGRSEGLRGHIDSWEQLTQDTLAGIQRFEARLREKFGRAFELHLFAHSWGGTIALKSLFRHPNLPLKSVAISAPLLDIRVEAPAFKKVAARGLSKIWPNLQMESGIDASGVCSDPEVVSAYKSDRLVHGKITPRMYTEMVDTMADLRSRKDGWNYAVEFYVPRKDKIVSDVAVLDFYRGLNFRDKSLKEYEEFYHESFNEPERAKAFEDLRQWILKNSDLT